MKKHILMLLAGACCASAATPAATTAATTKEDWTDAVKKALVVYENKDGVLQKVRLAWVEMFQMSAVQPSGGNGDHLKAGASPVNQEFRRTYLGVNLDFSTGTKFHTWVRPGGLPVRETYSGGRTKKNYSYFSFYDIYVSQTIPGVDGLTLTVGKMGTKLTTDYITSSSKIRCIERSLLSNQFAQDSNWGVDLTWKPNKDTQVFGQWMLNDRASASKNMKNSDVYRDGRGFKGEFGYEDKCFAIVGASHRLNKTEDGYMEVSGQYMHDFNNAYGNRRAKGANCYGMGFQDAVSLGFDYKKGRLTVINNVVAAFRPLGAPDKGSKNIGLQIQPIWEVNKHVDAVFRYTGMEGSNAVRIAGDRFICTQTTTPTWVSHLHAFYFGANIYASAKNKDALKFMVGAEYTNAHKDGKAAFSGWAFQSSVRWSF